MKTFKQFILEKNIDHTITTKFKQWAEGLPVIILEDGKAKLPKTGFVIQAYHGTKNGFFDKFDTSRSGYHYGSGSYFTPDMTHASSYAASAWSREYYEDSTLYTAYIKLKKPFITRSSESVMNLAFERVNKGLISWDDYPKGTGTAEIGNDILRKEGYDGVVKQWENDAVLEIVAFHSDQIFIIDRKKLQNESLSFDDVYSRKNSVGGINEDFMVKVNGKNIGYIKTSIQQDGEIWISSIYVEQPFRKMGYAKKMIEYIIEYYKKPINLRVFAFEKSPLTAKEEKLKDEQLIDFYKKLGFKPIPNMNKYYMRHE